MRDALYTSMTDKQIALRASEEIVEHGSIMLAIAFIDSELASATAEYPPAYLRAMRRVRVYLETLRLGAL